MEIDIVEEIFVNVITPGKLSVSAHTLYDIVRKLPEGSEILISLDEINLTISCGKSEFPGTALIFPPSN